MSGWAQFETALRTRAIKKSFSVLNSCIYNTFPTDQTHKEPANGGFYHDSQIQFISVATAVLCSVIMNAKNTSTSTPNFVSAAPYPFSFVCHKVCFESMSGGVFSKALLTPTSFCANTYSKTLARAGFQAAFANHFKIPYISHSNSSLAI